MILTACNCDGLPAHDHLMGSRLDESGVMGPWWDMDSIGRVWVDWKAVARALSRPDGPAPVTSVTRAATPPSPPPPAP